MHLSRFGILREMVKVLLGLAANVALGSGRHMQLGTVHARTAGSSRRTAQSAIVLAGDGLLETAGADIDGALVVRVPITGHRGLIGQGKVRLGLVNLLGLVGVRVDDGLQGGLAELLKMD
jgi:hypothetical protein